MDQIYIFMTNNDFLFCLLDFSSSLPEVDDAFFKKDRSSLQKNLMYIDILPFRKGKLILLHLSVD